MALLSDHGRRLLGLALLGLALLQLVLGQTLLKDSIKGWNFILFWLLCLALTAAAMFVALLDLRAVRRRVSVEHRSLLGQALRSPSSEPGPNQERVDR